MTVDIVNRQRKYVVNLSLLQERAEEILKQMDRARHEVSILLVNDRRIRALNAEYRGMNKATDVLSFSLVESAEGGWKPTHSHLGDIILSVETAVRQAQDRDGELGGVGYDLEDELTFLIVHGVLHLLGYDHMNSGEAREMEKEERKLFRSFSSHLPRAHHLKREAR